MNNSKGWGIKTLEDLEVGALFFEFVGEIINNEKASMVIG
jgi:hypothetical protein